MHDNDSFRLMDQDEAVGLVVLLIGFLIIAGVFSDARPKPQPIAQAPQSCEVTVVQYGPGQRWSPKPPVPACAGKLAALPAHVLTSPIQESK